MKIKIENNIPLTTHRKSSKYPFGELKVGQSFFVSSRSAKILAVRQSVVSFQKRNPGVAISVRKAPNGCRVYRVEK